VCVRRAFLRRLWGISTCSHWGCVVLPLRVGGFHLARDSYYAFRFLPVSDMVVCQPVNAPVFVQLGCRVGGCMTRVGVVGSGGPVPSLQVESFLPMPGYVVGKF